MPKKTLNFNHDVILFENIYTILSKNKRDYAWDFKIFLINFQTIAETNVKALREIEAEQTVKIRRHFTPSKQ